MYATLVFACLFGQFKRACIPSAALIRAWHYPLAARERREFATPRDAFPFTRAVQKLRISTLPAGPGDLHKKTVSIWIHEFGITMPVDFASNNPRDIHMMKGAIIENLVLVIAPGDTLDVRAKDCQFFAL